MASISVQFHALPDELAPMLAEAVRERALHITAMRFFPEFRIEAIPVVELPRALADVTVDRLAFTLEPPVASHSTLSFSDRNPGALIVDPGRLTERGLAESWLTARTSDPAAFAIWKTIAQRLRRMTRAGARAINPDTGASAPNRQHRWTEGAHALQDKGIRILPAAGGTLITLGLDPPGGTGGR